MPLEKAAAGTPGFSRNIATEIKAGKPQKQAVAIAYSKARGDAAAKVEIKRNSSNEANVSQRHVTFDVYVNGKYDKTFRDINDALDYKDKLTARSDAAEADADPVKGAQRNFNALERASGFKGSDADYERIAERSAKMFRVKWRWSGHGGIEFYNDSSEADAIHPNNRVRSDASSIAYGYKVNGNTRGTYATQAEASKKAREAKANYPGATINLFSYDTKGDGSETHLRMDSAKADCVFEEKGEFWFRRPGFREANGPFASEQEANEAAVKMGVVADAGREKDPFEEHSRLVLAAHSARQHGDIDTYNRFMAKAKEIEKQTSKHADSGDPCWDGYHKEGMKEKGGKSVPNCIPDSENKGEAIVGERADANSSSGSEFTIRYVNSSDKSDSVKVRAANSREAQDKAKRFLGKEIYRITSCEKTANPSQARVNQSERRGDATNQEKGGTKADAAVGFDKSRPDKPWFAMVGGKKQYFSFRQQAEAAKDSAKADIQVNWGAGNNVANGKSGDYSWKITRDVRGNHDCVIKKDGKRVFSSNAGKDPSVLAQKIEEYIRNRKDSTKADSTPIIVREGDQWIVQVTHGAEKSIFRISTKDYPTEAAALEYATTNPQYTNTKATNILDSVMSAADELFARAAKADAERDLPGAGTGEGGYDS